MRQRQSRNRVRLKVEECESRLVLSGMPITDYNGDGRSDIAFHRPGGPWNSVPTLFANGNGSWNATNYIAPSWANQPGVIDIVGDYNGDGRTDIAFHRPGSGWGTVPVLCSNGNGSWTASNYVAPSWANQPGVVAVAGDYNNDGRTDIAFHRPDGVWNSVPVLFANGNGSWTATNYVAPSWANQPGVVAVAGDYNGDGRSDIAFHKPGSTWGTVPVLFSSGNGSWYSTNYVAPSWANQPGVVAIPGDYNGDGRSEIAFHRPGSTWGTVPLLCSNGNGSWTATNYVAPSWANQPGVVAVTGDYNDDGSTDIAFHRPGSTWNSVPVLLSNGNGSWNSTNYLAPSWANQPGVVAVAGDYNGDGCSDIAFHRPGSTWGTVPVLFANGNGSWSSTNYATPSWANQPGVVAIAGPCNTDDWTIFVYVTASNLHNFAFADVNEMEVAAAELPSSVNIVVLWDQSAGLTQFATGNGSQAAWGTAGRAVIAADTNMNQVATTFEILGEQNTGTPGTLQDFLAWGVGAARADHYSLIMWNHGAGLDGFNFDDSDGVADDNMTTAELDTALGAAGMPRIELLSFDACLMGMAEVGYGLRNRADVYAASEELVSGPGHDYRTLFDALLTAPATVTATQLGSAFVTSFANQYVGTGTNNDTYSSVLTAGYAGLASALQAFVSATATATSADWTALRSARTAAIVYDANHDDYRDLGSFMQRVSSNLAISAGIRTAATNVLNLLTVGGSLVNARTADNRGSSGVAIFLPDAGAPAWYATENAAFTSATGWDTFLTNLATRSADPNSVRGRVDRPGTREAVRPEATPAAQALPIGDWTAGMQASHVPLGDEGVRAAPQALGNVPDHHRLAAAAQGIMLEHGSADDRTGNWLAKARARSLAHRERDFVIALEGVLAPTQDGDA